MNALVSVITPCFNHGRYLDECRDSVRRQTWPCVEQVIVNDGSTDRSTLRVLDRLRTKAGVRIVDQPNSGPAAARNAGMRVASGDFFFFLDSDDFLEARCVEVHMQALAEQREACFAYSHIRSVGRFRGTHFNPQYNLYHLLFSHTSSCMKLVRRRAWDEGFGFNENILGLEDWEYTLRLGLAGHHGVLVPEVLTIYRYTSGGRYDQDSRRREQIVRQLRAEFPEAYTEDGMLALKRAWAPAIAIACRAPDGGAAAFAAQTFRDFSIERDAPVSFLERHRLPFSMLSAVAGDWEPNALLRIAGALTSFPDIAGFWLRDPRSGRVVGNVRRNRPMLNHLEHDGQYLLWDHDWLLSPARESLRTPEGPRGVFRPHVPDTLRPAGHPLLRWIRHFSFRSGVFHTTEAASARARIKDRMERKLGRTFTACVERAYHLFRDLWLATGRRQRAGLFQGIAAAAQLNVSLTPLWHCRTVDAADAPRIGVLHLVPWLTTGGADKSTIDLISGIDRSRFRISVLTTLPSGNAWHDRVASLGVECLHLPTFLAPERFADFVRGFAASRNVSVIHVMNSRWAFENLREVKRNLPDIRCVSQIHADQPGVPREWEFLWQARTADDCLDVHTVTTHRLKRMLVDRYGIEPAKVEVITTNIDAEREFNPDRFARGDWRRAVGIDMDAPVVLFLGRFAEQKRPLLFLEVAQRVAKRHAEALFIMVGEGPLGDAMASKIDASAVLRRRARIFPATPDVAPILRDADVLLQPSSFEGLAYVSYEAMAMGLPQVFSNVGGQAELIEDETGILIDVGPAEAEELAAAVHVLLEDPGRRAAMGRAAREKVRRQYPIEEMVRNYAALYERLHAMRGPDLAN